MDQSSRKTAWTKMKLLRNALKNSYVDAVRFLFPNSIGVSQLGW